MPFRYRPLLLSVLTAAAFLALSAPAFAAETASSELVIIREGDTVDGDLYATGGRVLIEGLVDGDLIALAAEDVVISGRVTGSVVVIAPSVTVSGEVGGSLRFAASDLALSGSISGDLVGVAVGGELGEGSTIGGDVLVWAFDLEASGSIGGDLAGTQRSLALEGYVGGDVDVTVGSLAVTGPLQVTGDLGYRSRIDAEGLDQADVGGAVVSKEPLPPNIRVRALGLVARLLTVLGLTVAAVLVAWGWPDRLIRASAMTRRTPLKAWGFGALVVFSPLLITGFAALLFGLTPTSASLPLLAIFIPLITLAGGLVFLLALIAGAPAVHSLGRVLPGSFGTFGSILLGSALVGLLWLVPWVGWLVPLLVLPLGLGGWMLSIRGDAGQVVAAAPTDA